MGRLKIVFPVCCGMDVHRDFVIACIASTNSQGVTAYQSKRFSTYTGDLRKLAAWLKENHCSDVCMESTGKYWFPVHNILEKDFHVVVSHPKFVKAIKGKKTDKKDAMWIADLFKHDLVRGSFIPPEDIRQLRDLCRYYQNRCKQGQDIPKSRIGPASGSVRPWRSKGGRKIPGSYTSRKRSNKWN